MRAACMPTTISAYGPGRGTAYYCRPATRRAPSGTRSSRTSTCRTNCASARRTIGVCARSPARITRTTSCTTRPAGCTRPFLRAPRTGPAGTPGNTGCLSNVGTAPGTNVVNPGVQSDNTSFYQDTIRETKQTAFFASVDFDLIPKVLTITAGTRHFQFENSFEGQRQRQLRLLRAGRAGRRMPSLHTYNLNAQNLRDTESGFKSRGNLTWHITPDHDGVLHLLAGLSPGRLQPERRRTACLRARMACRNTRFRSAYSSDKLTNNEIGWKTEFFDHRLQWNGAVYRENWNDVQVAFFNPGVVGNIFYNTNGQNFLIKGIETSLVARVINGLTLQGAASWNHSRQTEFAGADRQQSCKREFRQADHGSLRRRAPARRSPTHSARSAPRAPMLRRCSSACAPATTGSINGYSPFVQFGATHSGHSFTQAGSNPTIAAGRKRQYRPLAVRKSRLLDLRCVDRRREGCVDRDRVRRKSQQFEREHVRQHRSIHRRADAAAAAGARRLVRLQILTGQGCMPARISEGGAGSAVPTGCAPCGRSM